MSASRDPDALDPAALLAQVALIAAIAGDAACAHAPGPHVLKGDGSPVTDADHAANAVILSGLRHLAPAIPIVSEESALPADAPGRLFWLVDPLDGTREFIAGSGEWTVNIALIADGRPVLGVVRAPALGISYEAAGPGTASCRRDGDAAPIAVRAVPEAGLVVVGSRSHGDAAAMDAFLAGRRVQAFRPAGSSLKLCLVAAGEADLYPRLGTTMEWDIAAGHAVLEAAGGTLVTLDGRPFSYGKPAWRNPHFVAQGRLGTD